VVGHASRQQQQGGQHSQREQVGQTICLMSVDVDLWLRQQKPAAGGTARGGGQCFC